MKSIRIKLLAFSLIAHPLAANPALMHIVKTPQNLQKLSALVCAKQYAQKNALAGNQQTRSVVELATAVGAGVGGLGVSVAAGPAIIAGGIAAAGLLFGVVIKQLFFGSSTSNNSSMIPQEHITKNTGTIISPIDPKIANRSITGCNAPVIEKSAQIGCGDPAINPGTTQPVGCGSTTPILEQPAMGVRPIEKLALGSLTMEKGRSQTRVEEKSPENDERLHGAQAPGKPTEADGFVPAKNWDGKKVKSPNGRGWGYPDKNGKVWVPSGPNGHGGPHWDVQYPNGVDYDNIVPGGGVRGKK